MAGEHGGDESGYLDLALQVGGVERVIAAGEAGEGLLGSVAALLIVHRDGGAAAGELSRHGATDAARGAGDQGDLTGRSCSRRRIYRPLAHTTPAGSARSVEWSPSAVPTATPRQQERCAMRCAAARAERPPRSTHPCPSRNADAGDATVTPAGSPGGIATRATAAARRPIFRSACRLPDLDLARRRDVRRRRRPLRRARAHAGRLRVTPPPGRARTSASGWGEKIARLASTSRAGSLPTACAQRHHRAR